VKALHIGRPTLATLLLLAATGMSALALTAALDRLQTSQSERDAKAEIAERLVRNRSARSVTAAKDPGQPGDLLVVAGSETLAAAEVDRLVRGSVLKASAAVLSSRASVDRDGDKTMRRIAVEAVVEGGMETLQRLLFKLETGSPMIIVEELSIQPTIVSGTRSARDDSQILHATLALSAYWRASP
jgi:general secretion pathway protein M